MIAYKSYFTSFFVAYHVSMRKSMNQLNCVSACKEESSSTHFLFLDTFPLRRHTITTITQLGFFFQSTFQKKLKFQLVSDNRCGRSFQNWSPMISTGERKVPFGPCPAVSRLYRLRSYRTSLLALYSIRCLWSHSRVADNLSSPGKSRVHMT